MDGIKEEAVGYLFNAEIQIGDATPAPAPAQEGVPLPERESSVEVQAKGFGQRQQPRALQYTSPTIDGAAGGGAAQVQQAPALGLGGSDTAASQGRKPSPRGRGGSRGGQGHGGRGGQGGGQGGSRAAAAQPVGTVRAPASRNSPCPCGSGKKYKRCHGATE